MVNTIAVEPLALAEDIAHTPVSLKIKDRIRETGRQEFVLAAIDIGTNSVHMVIANIDAALP